MFHTSFRWLSHFSQSPEGKLWDGEGVVAPAEGASSAPAVSPAASTPAAAPAVATPQQPQSTPATPSVPDGYVPGYRLREAADRASREAAAKYEGQMSQIKAELDRYRNQVQALVGVTPQQTTEADAIKAQFFQLFPWAKKMEEKFGDFESLVERAGDMEAQNQHYWTSYGKQSMDRLFTLASESLGAPLTEDGKRQLHSSFVGYVQASPERTDRYSNDPTIVEDFWKEFTSSFVDPARRASGAAVASRATTGRFLPQDSPSGTPQTTPVPKLNGLDERAAAAWAEFQQRTGKV